jgi:CheY-like chemotaxis protein
MKRDLILLVEDNPDDVDLTLRALSRGDPVSDVVVCRDGPEALDYLLGTGVWADAAVRPRPSLVLLDLKLPRIDGSEVLRRLRADARTRGLPVVVLTSSAEVCDIAECYRLGCNSYIRKPIDFEQFASALDQLRGYWLRLNEAPPEHGEAAAGPDC